MRVYELAKELGVGNPEILERLKELGIPTTNHMSSLDETQARKVRDSYLRGAGGAEAASITVKRLATGAAAAKGTTGTVVRRRKVATAEEPVVPVELEPAPQAEEPAPRPIAAPVAPVAAAPEPETKAAVPAAPLPAPAPVVAEAVAAAPVPQPSEPRGAVITGSIPAALVQRQIRRPMTSKAGPGVAPAPVAPPREDEDVAEGRRRVVTKRKYKHVIADDVAAGRRKKKFGREDIRPAQASSIAPKESKRKVRIEEMITVAELARALSVKSPEIIRKFIEQGMMVTINEAIDAETAGIIASDYGYEIEKVGYDEAAVLEAGDDGEKHPRAPVVTVMGHVDHGKTSLLDAIRKTSVASSEAGGITQHIGAYTVVHSDRPVTFIDTPGHEAFTAMRARGAEATDIVVLVVAADDGVMPQTIEAIKHAKAASVPIVVAMNKIDLPGAKPEVALRGLNEHGLVPEAWGGEIQVVEVSAKTGQGLGDLLGAILVQADVLELTANAERAAVGIVLESRMEKGRGVIVDALVKDGTLHHGDIIVCGPYYCRVRAMSDDKGQRIKDAGPSTPVEILGFAEIPDAGSLLHAVDSERKARQLVEHRQGKARASQAGSRLTLEEVYERFQAGETATLNLLIKADVHGSAEALTEAVRKMKTDKYNVNVVASGVGAVTENDVNLAAAAKALIIGFNTRPDSKASNLANHMGVEIRNYSVIYKAIEEIEAALLGMLKPEIREESMGWLRVKESFPIKNLGTIAGCEVISGKISRGKNVRLVRSGKVLYDGTVGNLRRFKDDVKEVTAGLECGVLLDNHNDVLAGDELECYTTVEVAAQRPRQNA